MGLTTIDPHSHKLQTKLFNIPNFGVNRPNSKPLKMLKFTKKCVAIRTLCRDGQTFLCKVLTFLNGYLSQNLSD